MAKFKLQRQRRYDSLLDVGFNRNESYDLSKLYNKDMALRQMVKLRRSQAERFDLRNAKKVGEGRWRATDKAMHWNKYLIGWYKRNGYLVKQGASGRQQKMAVGSPNVWAWYRAFAKQYPQGHRYTSPWEVKQIKTGKTMLDKGLVFVQRQEKSGGSGVPPALTGQWLLSLAKKIAHSKSDADRKRYTTQYNRLALSAGRATR